MKPILALSLWAVASAAPASEDVVFPGRGLELQARLYRPEGAGPFPAVILLHGCAGMRGRNGRPVRSYDAWAEAIRARGFAALLVDSFGPRGEREICTHRKRTIRAEAERVEDAVAALRWLGSRSDVLRDRIHLLGWSNGGTTVLNVLRRPAEPGPTGFWFRSAVAFYPGCDLLARAAYTPSAPLLIQAGEDDDWTPAQRCVALKEASAGGSIEIDVYPGAPHGFDRVEGRMRYLPEVRNPNAPNGRGATVGPHPEARQRSRERALTFLRQHDMQFHVEHRPAASGALP